MKFARFFRQSGCSRRWGRVQSSAQASDERLNSSPAQFTGRVGDYRLVREIGRGGMGIVYEARREIGSTAALR